MNSIKYVYGMYLQITEGRSEPTDDYIWVNYFTTKQEKRPKGDEKKWVRGEKKFTVELDEIVEFIQPPLEMKVGSRIFYHFPGAYSSNVLV